jgi:hypothetical protein
LLSNAARTTQRSYTQARARVGLDPALPYAWHLTSACLPLAPHAAGCKDGLCLELQCQQDACTFRASRPLWTLSFSPSCWISALSGRFTAIMTCHRVRNSGVIYSVLGMDGYRAPAPALRTLSSLPVCASSSTCLTGYICHAPDNEIPRGGSGSYLASCTDSTDQSAARNKALQ